VEGLSAWQIFNSQDVFEMTTTLRPSTSQVLICLLALSAAAVLFGSQLLQPRFRGKTFPHWLQLSRFGSTEEKQVATSMFHDSGEQGLKFLQQQLDTTYAGHERWRQILHELGFRQRFGRLQRQEQALRILDTMGSRARLLVPTLLQMARRGEEPRLSVYQTLASIGIEEDTVVPTLIDGLNTNEKSARANAAAALGRFGPRAKKAVPAILSLHRDSQSPSERAAFAEALRQIDPHSMDEVEFRH